MLVLVVVATVFRVVNSFKSAPRLPLPLQVRTPSSSGSASSHGRRRSYSTSLGVGSGKAQGGQGQRRLIIGANKYSHDASICVLDANTGVILFTQAKERITGRKHDGGAVGELVDYALEYLPPAPMYNVMDYISLYRATATATV